MTKEERKKIIDETFIATQHTYREVLNAVETLNDLYGENLLSVNTRFKIDKTDSGSRYTDNGSFISFPDFMQYCYHRDLFKKLRAAPGGFKVASEIGMINIVSINGWTEPIDTEIGKVSIKISIDKKEIE